MKEYKLSISQLDKTEHPTAHWSVNDNPIKQLSKNYLSNY